MSKSIGTFGSSSQFLTPKVRKRLLRYVDIRKFREIRRQESACPSDS